MIHDYCEYRHDLKQLTANLQEQSPQVMKDFGRLQGSTMRDGVLRAAHKELIALGIAISVRCEGCITFHVREALAAGATLAEINECIGVAILMGGGPSVIFGAQALEAAEQFFIQESCPVPAAA